MLREERTFIASKSRKNQAPKERNVPAQSEHSASSEPEVFCGDRFDNHLVPGGTNLDLFRVIN